MIGVVDEMTYSISKNMVDTWQSMTYEAGDRYLIKDINKGWDDNPGLYIRYLVTMEIYIEQIPIT